MPIHRPVSRRTVVRLLAVATVSAATLGMLSGCSSTDVDVYVPTAITVRSDADQVLSVISYTLDERGNATEAHVQTIAADYVVTSAFDTYGVPTAPEGQTRTVTYDDKGQPTQIEDRDASGAAVASWHYTYFDVQGRILEATYQGPDYSYDVVFGRDGWPLSGEVTIDGMRHAVNFVYEVDLNGAVTRQNISFNKAEEPALWYTYTYEEIDQTSLVATCTANDGTTTSYTYTLVENPTPYAMAMALLHAPNYEALVAQAQA